MFIREIARMEQKKKKNPRRYSFHPSQKRIFEAKEDRSYKYRSWQPSRKTRCLAERDPRSY